MSRIPRVLHAAASEAQGRSLRLAREEAEHVARVLRLVPGDALRVLDGLGREWNARLLAVSGAAVDVELEDELRAEVESPTRLELVQSLCRPERLDWLVQKATEIGVHSIRLLCAERGQREVTPNRLRRWRRIAVEAVKQSGRRRVPAIDLVTGPPIAVGQRRLDLLLHPAAPALGRSDPGFVPEAVGLAVGPEGGFSDAEVEDWERHGWRPTALGPRILRSETAGLVAAAICLHRWGDLGREPERRPGPPPHVDAPDSRP